MNYDSTIKKGFISHACISSVRGKEKKEVRPVEQYFNIVAIDTDY